MADIVVGRFAHGFVVLLNLESKPNTSVDNTSIQRGPCIDRPAAIRSTIWPKQWVPTGLPDVAKVLRIEKYPDPAKSPFAHQASQNVGFRFRTIGILLQKLASGVIAFNANF